MSIKQIEVQEAIREIAEILTNSPSCIRLPCAECEYRGEPNCMECFKARQIYNAGYRKQSEGEWGFDGMSWTCSECGEYAPIDKHRNTIKSKYCPNCGARMKGV